MLISNLLIFSDKLKKNLEKNLEHLNYNSLLMKKKLTLIAFIMQLTQNAFGLLKLL